jgi:hypothetical protein
MQNHARRQKKLEKNYTLDAKSLLKTEVEKDLSGIISSNLKWDQHINNAVSKANRKMGMIKHSFNYLDVKLSRLLFKSLVRPHLEYAAQISI